MKLLIADDEPAVRALVHATLEGDDYEILEAGDGEEALEVCRRLKAGPETSDIVIVMLTAQAQERDRDHGLAAGADDYFTKPFSPLALLNMVENLRVRQNAG